MVWKNHHSLPSTVPGTLIAPPRSSGQVSITAMHYNTTHYTETPIDDLEAYLATAPGDGVLWLNIEGLGDIQVLKTLGQHFGLHALALEDVLNVPHRPKMEDHETYAFLIFHMALSASTEAIEQVSVFFGPSHIVTIQEGHVGDVFGPIRQRLRLSHGRLRHSGADYLAYALLDAAIDSFFPLLDTLGARLEELEDEVMDATSRETLEEIYSLRRMLSALRRNLWPLRETIATFSRHDSELVAEETRFFLRDCSDHILQILDVLESYREIAIGLMETYLSFQSHRLNEVMKVLTIIATIFIPLTFIAGIYGMNFDTQQSPLNMPELHWYWGYPASLGLMAIVAIVLIIFFRRKGWL